MGEAEMVGARSSTDRHGSAEPRHDRDRGTTFVEVLVSVILLATVVVAVGVAMPPASESHDSDQVDPTRPGLLPSASARLSGKP